MRFLGKRLFMVMTLGTTSATTTCRGGGSAAASTIADIHLTDHDDLETDMLESQLVAGTA